MPRTTLTLEEDVATRLEEEARRSRRPFKEVVNELLRFALDSRRRKVATPPFRVKARDLGLRAGLSYDDVGGLLEQIEAPERR